MVLDQTTAENDHAAVNGMCRQDVEFSDVWWDKYFFLMEKIIPKHQLREEKNITLNNI